MTDEPDEQLTLDEEAEDFDTWIRSLAVDQDGKRAGQPTRDDGERAARPE